MASVVEKFLKKSINEFGIHPLHCVSLPGYTWLCALNFTGINLQTLQNEDMILTFENNFRGGISSVMGDIFVESDVNEKIINIDANNLYGHSMSQPLPIDEIEFWQGHPDL